MSDDLISWLRRQLDKDEKDVEFAIGIELENLARNDCPTTREELMTQVSWAPRGLREVEARRRRIKRHSPLADVDYWTPCSRCLVPWPCDDLRDDAAIYSDRPGYREEWKP